MPVPPIPVDTIIMRVQPCGSCYPKGQIGRDSNNPEKWYERALSRSGIIHKLGWQGPSRTDCGFSTQNMLRQFTLPYNFNR